MKYLAFVHGLEPEDVKRLEGLSVSDSTDASQKQRKINDVLTSVITLHENYRIEEGFMLKWAVNLGLGPYQLSLMLYDSLNTQGCIKYCDDLAGRFKMIILNDEVLSEMLFLKKLKMDGLVPVGASMRYGRDQAEIKGDFVLSFSGSSIYGLFKSKFKGLLDDWCLLPSQVAALSEGDIEYGLNIQTTKPITNHIMGSYL